MVHLNSTKRKGDLMIVMALVAGLSMDSVASSLLVGVIIVVVLAGGLAPMAWRSFRTELPWEQKHRLKVEEDSLVHLNEGTTISLKFSAIHNVIIKWKHGKVKSITIDRGKGMKEEMPQYENIDMLASEIKQKIPSEKIINKKTFF